MTTVFAGGPPPELEDWLDRRRRLGLDQWDEIWEGVLHVAPHAASGHGSLEAQVEHLLFTRARAAGLTPGGRFNLGEPEDYRVPDGGYYRERPGATYIASAAVIVEILSPRDETYDKFRFYAAHGVEEVLVVDPASCTVQWWALRDGSYAEEPASVLLAVTGDELAAEIDWP